MIVSTDELKAHLNVTLDDDDALLQAKIAAAEGFLERFTGKAFLTQTLTALFDAFPCALELPRCPVQSISSITYLDADRAEQTLSAGAYSASPLNIDQPALIYPAVGTTWPATAGIAGSVKVTYVAGYSSDAAAVPAPLHEAVLQLAAHFYENREAVLVGVNAQTLPLGVHDLVRDFRQWVF